MKRKQGKDLKTGDVLKVWWKPRRDAIVSIAPYGGSLAHLFPEGASIASFALCASGMTIDHGAYYDLA